MSVELETRLPRRDRESPPRDSEVVELSLLLPSKQFLELEAVARGQGVSTGQMLRRLVHAFLHEPL